MRTKNDINILKHFVDVFPFDDGHVREFSNRELYYLFAGVIDGAKDNPFFKSDRKYFHVGFEVEKFSRGNIFLSINREFHMKSVLSTIRISNKIPNEKEVYINFIREISEKEFDANSSNK